jgi:drug/metabolite transporter (DMT)-like permease
VHQRQGPSFVPYAMLASSQLAVGAAAIFARFALGGAPPLAVAAWRLVIASAVLLLIAGVAPRQARGPSIPQDDNTSIPRDDNASIPQDDNVSIPRDDEKWIFMAAGLALAVHFAAWIWSLDYTSVAVSTLLVATTPIWTAVYDSAVYKRHLSPIAVAALAAAGAGFVLVVGFNMTRPPIAGHQLLGGALAIIGAIAIGAYFLLVREVRAAHTTRSIVTRTYTWAAFTLLVASLAARQAPPPIADAKAWGGIIAMALVSQLLGHTALNASLRWFSPSAVAMTTLLEPVIAALLALAIFGERLAPLAITGGLLVLIAIGVFLREEREAIPQA